MMRFRMFSAVVAIVVLCAGYWPSEKVEAQVATWFKADLSNPNANGANQYNFDYLYSTGLSQGLWTFTHMPTGNYNGGPAAHMFRPTGATDYTFGWYAKVNANFSLGDAAYLRFRVRLDDSWRWRTDDDPEFENKFILWGGGENDSIQSRVLVLWERPASQMRCTLGANPANPGVNTTPAGYGLSGSNWDPYGPYYGSMSVHVNISTECAGPALLTYATNPTQPAPGPNSAPAVNGWYHVQVYMKSGANGTGQFKMWVNNNNASNPTYTSPGISLGVGGWGNNPGSGGFTVGGYTSGAPNPATGHRLGAIEAGPTFDPNWAPGGGGGNGPMPPSNLRIVS